MEQSLVKTENLSENILDESTTIDNDNIHEFEASTVELEKVTQSNSAEIDIDVCNKQIILDDPYPVIEKGIEVLEQSFVKTENLLEKILDESTMIENDNIHEFVANTVELQKVTELNSVQIDIGYSNKQIILDNPYPMIEKGIEDFENLKEVLENGLEQSCVKTGNLLENILVEPTMIKNDGINESVAATIELEKVTEPNSVDIDIGSSNKQIVLDDPYPMIEKEIEDFENLKEVPENISCYSDPKRVVVINLRQANFKKRRLNKRDPATIANITEVDKKDQWKEISSRADKSMTTLADQSPPDPKRKLNTRDPDIIENITENVNKKEIDKEGQSNEISSSAC